MGAIFGVFLTGWLTHCQLMLTSNTAAIAGFLLTLLSKSLLMAGIGLMLCFAARMIQMNTVASFISQSVAEERRKDGVMRAYLVLGVATTVIIFVFWLVPKWEIVVIVGQILPLIVINVLIMTLLEDTPFEIMTTSDA